MKHLWSRFVTWLTRPVVENIYDRRLAETKQLLATDVSHQALAEWVMGFDGFQRATRITVVQKNMMISAREYLAFFFMERAMGNQAQSAPFEEARRLYEEALLRARRSANHHKKVMLGQGVREESLEALTIKVFRLIP